MDYAQGLARAAREDRLLVSSVHEQEQRTIDGTSLAGRLAEDAGSTPHVDVSLDDRTGAKMSYFLRYDAYVQSSACVGDRQALTGSMRLSQAVEPRVAATLPAYVTGDGVLGTPTGHQSVSVHLHGPHGGAVDDLRVNGERVEPLEVVELGGRPVVSHTVLVGDEDVRWRMSTGPGQTGDGLLGLTPSVVPGDNDEVFASSC